MLLLVFLGLLTVVLATFPQPDADPARLAEINKAYRMLTGEEVGQVEYTPLPTKKEIKEQQEQRAIAISDIKRYAQRRIGKEKKQDVTQKVGSPYLSMFSRSPKKI